MPMPDPAPPTPVAPEVLARVVACLNENGHDGRDDWDRAYWYSGWCVRSAGTENSSLFRMSSLSALAVAVYCYGMPDPRETKKRRVEQ